MSQITHITSVATEVRTFHLHCWQSDVGLQLSTTSSLK